MSSSQPCCAGASLPVAREPLEPREATLASLICGRLPGVRLNEHLSHPGDVAAPPPRSAGDYAARVDSMWTQRGLYMS